MVQGGAFDKIRDEQMISVLTGAQTTVTGARRQVTFDVLDPDESRGGLDRCQTIRDYALRLEERAQVCADQACAARDQVDDDGEAVEVVHRVHVQHGALPAPPEPEPGRSRVLAGVLLLFPMTKWRFAGARSYFVGLLMLKMAVRVRLLMFACFA